LLGEGGHGGAILSQLDFGVHVDFSMATAFLPSPMSMKALAPGEGKS
jgi:hypothetical protein